MKHERRELAVELLLAALQREPGQRGLYLREACAGDESLRREVESLLFSHEQAGSFLEELPLEIAAEVLAAERAGSLVGHSVGPFQIESLVGSGGMGEVYRATDSRLGRTVAVKFLSSRFAHNSEFRQRLEREGLAISRLNHPNICTLYDVGRHEEIDYLVMEYLEGETLAQRLSKGALPVADALRYGIEIAAALEAAHQRGITHRDVKPGNIMLVGDSCKLLDFGLAKLHSPVKTPTGPLRADTGEGNTTVKGTILGTVQYMAPEQLEGREVDGRADIFALGAVVHEMVTGRKAFEATSQAGLIAAVMSSNPVAISTSQPMAPAGLDSVVRRCLAKKPEERWQTAVDIRKELQRIAERAPKPALAIGRFIPAPSDIFSRRAWILGAVGGAAALSAKVTLLRRGASATERSSFQISLPEGTALASTVDFGGPAVSRDGKRVVLAATRDGHTRLYTRLRNSAELTPVQGAEDGHHPFWSPDGREIGFFANGKLKTVSASGGAPHTICDASLPSDNQGKGGAWNDRGEIIFAGVNRSPLYFVRLGEPGNRIELTTLRGKEGRHCWPWFLPDGRRFIYFAWAPTEGNGAVYAGSLDDSSLKKLILPDHDSSVIYAGGHLLYVKNEDLMAHRFNLRSLQLEGDAFTVQSSVGVVANTFRALFSASEEKRFLVFYGIDASTIARFDRDKNRREVGPDRSYVGIRLSPDGEKAAFGTRSAVPGTRTGTLGILNLKSERVTPYNGGPGVRSPVFSIDGSQILFGVETEGAAPKLYRTILAADQPEVLSEDESLGLTPLDVSRDGRFLLLLRKAPARDANAHLWYAALTPDGRAGEPKPFYETKDVQKEGRFSPNALWVAYTSAESGRDEVVVQAFPPSGRSKVVVISTNGGNSPVWNSAREIVYRAPDNWLMSVPLEWVGPEPQVRTAQRLFKLPDSSVPDGADGEMQRWDMTADGKLFYVILSRPTAITAVLNWNAGSQT